ncbi:MAG: hypothetical protein BSOLF_1106 [Candidatus Carbobacillus altaicus]|uniref:Uncharacterized protein n=1 Tax=Candidatus Carbonibacillus altaicus TaxID=2163959 RepID=A0A2R6XZS6_9BACL|nr:MAG: hypothetical protein BSOLF_1106 [Candidatus Carbobacillus altaicus]
MVTHEALGYESVEGLFIPLFGFQGAFFGNHTLRPFLG